MTAPKVYSGFYMGDNMLLLVNGDGSHILVHRGVEVVLPRVPAADLVADLRPDDRPDSKAALIGIASVDAALVGGRG